MNTDDDSFGCLGIPTPLEMWKQHAALVEAEAECLARELHQSRLNLIKLVEMHSQTAAERDKAVAELTEKTRLLSAAYAELSVLKNTINGRLFLEERAAAEKYHSAAGDSGLVSSPHYVPGRPQ